MNQMNARRETLLILAITTVAGVVRLWYPDRLGLDHFDEGIYALSGLWSTSPKGLWSLDPMVIPYAPPGVPILIGLAYVIFGVSDIAAILVSIVSGTLTIAAIGWVGRRTFGPGAGAAAAGLAALSGTHLLFSRMALTDATFLLGWVIGLGVGGQFLEKPSLKRGLMLGLVVGIVMNLKYNGWLVGVLVALAALWELIFDRAKRTRQAVARTFGFGVLGAVVAGLIYLPWVRFVERHGGYSGLVAHHRSYLGGPATWLPHWRQQLAQVTALSGGEYWLLSAWTLACVGLMLAVVQPKGTARPDKTGRVWLVALLGYGGIAYAMLPTAGWWLSLAVVPWLLRLNSSARLLAIGWVTLSVMTPFYHPYARLWLPLHAFGWLILGGILREVFYVTWFKPEPGLKLLRSLRIRWLAGLSLGVLLAYLESTAGTARAIPLPTPTGLYPISWTKSELMIARRSCPLIPGPIRIYARPSLLFYLSMIWQGPVYRTSSAQEALAVNGPSNYTLLDEAIFTADDFAKVPLARSLGWEEPLSPVTWLDIDPSAAYGQSSRRKVQVVLLPTTALQNTLGGRVSPLTPLIAPQTLPSNP